MLVVNDSATIRDVVAKMLARDGHVVLKLADGDTAIGMAKKKQFDLIFLDIVMPGMKGFGCSAPRPARAWHSDRDD